MKARAFRDSLRGIVAFYAAAAIVFTWPLARYAGSRIPAGDSDVWQNLWNFWWWREALLHLGTNPYATDRLFHPHGASLVLHTHSTFNQIVAFPINALFGEVAALDFSTLLGFALAGIAAHQLAFELTRDRGAAYLAGLVYAFFPHHMEQSLEHLNLSTLEFLPWIALYGLRVARGGTRRDALAFGGVFALGALGCWHYALFTLFFLPFVVWMGWTEPPGFAARFRRSLVCLALAAGVVAVVMAPFAIGMIAQASLEDAYVKPPVERGIDLAFLFVPSDRHPLFGTLTRHYYQTHRRYGAVGSQAYLGFTPLVLALLALRRPHRDRAALAWLGIFAIGIALAAGSTLTISGHATGIPGPHAVLRHLPLLANLRVANRFVVIAMLALAMLAALGVARGLAGRRHAAWIACGLVAFEYLWLPYPTRRVDMSPILDRLHDEPAGAVIDIPLSDASPAAANLAAQTRHGHPIAGGYISLAPTGAAALARDPVLAALAGFAPEVPERIDVEHLHELGFRYVVFHKDRTLDAMRAALARLGPDASFYERRRYAGRPGLPHAVFEALSRGFEREVGPPYAEDDRVRVYRLDGEAPVR